jgi:hypothetical protein
LTTVRWDALKKLNIFSDERITILMNNSPSSLYGKANPSRAHSEANGVKVKADDAFGVIFALWREDVGEIKEKAFILPPAPKELK